MHTLSALAVNPMNPQSLLKWAGVWALWLVIFAETGLLVGFFLPGDTLLFLAGVASSSIANELVGAHLPFVSLLIFTPIVAIAGAQCGYVIGKRYGVRIFDRPNSRIFKKEYVEKTETVFRKFGGMKAVVLARFIPVVRTFLNPAAAILEMPAKKFFVANVIGAVIWTDSILLIGHFLANQINNTIGANNIDKLILAVVALVIIIAAVPIAIDIIGRIRRRRNGVASSTEQGGEQAGPSGSEHTQHTRSTTNDDTVMWPTGLDAPTIKLATVPDRGAPQPTPPPPADWPHDAPPHTRHGRHEGRRGA